MRNRRSLAQSRNYKWWVFGAIGSGLFVTVMDQSGIILALPRIASHFDATIPAVQWVVLGYILTASSLLLPMSRLSDMIGRKRVYTAGFGIFITCAALAGSAPSLEGVILFKLLQGVGAAMIQANSMAIVTSTFPNEERGRAIGLLMTVVGVGALAGPIMGGAVVGWLGWRFIFFMGIPLGLASALAALVVLKGQLTSTKEDPALGGSFDWVGAFLSSVALASFLVVMSVGYRIGWASPEVIATFAGVAALFVGFVTWELRSSEPLLPLELFKRSRFSLGASANFLAFIASASIYFLMPFYLQDVLGYTPGQAGLIMGSTAMCFITVGPIVGHLSDRFGWQRFTTGGLVASSAGLLLLSRLTETSPLALVVGALALAGSGMAAFYTPNASAILSSVERPRYGIAIAFLNMTRNTANVTGVALVTIIVTGTMASMGFEPTLEAVAGEGGDAVKGAFTLGLSRAFLVGASLTVLALLLSILKRQDLAEHVEAVPVREEHTPSGEPS